MAKLNTVFLGLGSNLKRAPSLRAGLRFLTQHFGPLTVSSVYESPASGYQGPCYYNLAVGLTTPLDVWTLARRLKQSEFALGRPANSRKFSPRALDIDLLLYEQHMIDSHALTLPRADVLRDAFVLAPLAEIAPDYQHPLTQRALAEHWQDWPKPVTCQRLPLSIIGWPLAKTTVKDKLTA
ncbi:MAG: 2-amino-4-hydroxy-6-hydroxymethyldihydropteridine diphosphokinase [Methylococcales bacterium]|nr:2-amino-4-hydroxy-6-hydroxymethyldihydropteridine diphosphokinase [Methylococcales bacterium]